MKHIAFWLLLLCGAVVNAQHTFKAKVIDKETKEPLIGATTFISPSLGGVTDHKGIVEINNIMTNIIKVKISYVGFQEFQHTFHLPQTELQIIELIEGEELEEVIVNTTRSSRTIEDIPTRIELLNDEELQEKAIMRSTNIAMVLRESTGIQMQMTSASSANQSIRIQGLDGRYTQMLKDGFPIFGGFSSGLSIMQIPPLDLKQVEVVKGSNSTLFGGGAIAGLVNLITISPEEEGKLKLMIDQTLANGTTFNGFYAKKFNKLGLSLFTSAHRQKAYDANNDEFSDIPKIRSITVNPSLYYYPNAKSSIRFTINATLENRFGGDMQMIENNRIGTHGFTEENASDRFSYQLTYRNEIDKYHAINVKSSLTYFDREIREPSFIFQGKQKSFFGEINYEYGNQKSTWISGLNLYTDKFSETPFDNLRRDYSYATFGVFTQNTYDLSKVWALETGLRFDYDVDFGFFALPRLSILAKLSPLISTRIGGGMGYKQPTIFTEDAENQNFQNIQPIHIDATDAERSVGINFDVNLKIPLGEEWSLNLNQLFFWTSLKKSVVLRENNANQFIYENANGPVTSQGIETNLKLSYKDFKLFANYAFVDTRLKFDNLNQQKPLTPKHTIGAILIYEEEGKWRIGYEAYFTGSQYRTDLSKTENYWIMGFMVMRKIKKVSLYMNFENFTDTRQHNLENFQASDHFKPEFPQLWAPTDGSIINAGLILEL